MTTLLSELAALEQSTDPEKREVGARLRTVIRNMLLTEMRWALMEEFVKEFTPTEFPWDWEVRADEFVNPPRKEWEVSGSPAGAPGWFYKEHWVKEKVE